MAVKILGDYTISEFIKDVKIEEILGMRFEFVYVSTVTSLALELDPHGSEKLTIICCMSSIFDEFLISNSQTDQERAFGRLRVMFESYLSANHDIYYCPPLGWSPMRVSREYLDMLGRFNVGFKVYI